MKLTGHPTGLEGAIHTPCQMAVPPGTPGSDGRSDTPVVSILCSRGQGRERRPFICPQHTRAHTHSHTFTHASAPSVPTGFETVGKPQGKRWAGRRKRWGQGVPCSEVTCKFKLCRKVSKRQDSLCPWQKGWGGQHDMGQRGEASPDSPLMGPTPNPDNRAKKSMLYKTGQGQGPVPGEPSTQGGDG